jgi:hypothetical protein
MSELQENNLTYFDSTFSKFAYFDVRIYEAIRSFWSISITY